MPPKKSIYRGPNAQHFQLVHRSVRDPLINDPEASQQVFKPVERYNDKDKTGLTLADLEESVDKSEIRKNEGEAALYGITYDDSSYDYMSHLKPVGEAFGGAESVLLAAPRGGSGVARGMKSEGKGKARAREEDMFVLPASVLPSREEISLQAAYASQQPVPFELQGLQPDMDPHLRQVLEALDDDAFVDDDADDEGVFDELLGGGELFDGEEAEEFEFSEWGVDEGGARKRVAGAAAAHEDDDDDEEGVGGGAGETWEERYAAFKRAGGRPAVSVPAESEIDDAERSEMADTIGSLVSNFDDLVVRGGKKRHGKRGPSDASGMSMSSSNVYRNDNLRTLDLQFDKIANEYEFEDDDEWSDEDDGTASVAPSMMSTSSRLSLFSRPPPPGQQPEMSRDDLDAIFDEFLNDFEVVGNRMRPSLGGTALTGAEKLQVLRAALEEGDEGLKKEDNRRRILEIERLGRTPGGIVEANESLPMRDIEPSKEAKWDVETILSTYTNTENIPGVIRVRNSEEAKARAERRAKAAAAAAAEEEVEDEDEDDSGSETEREDGPRTVARPKGESSDDRKARKAAVKAERSARRAEKKQHKETFGNERKRQLASHKKLVSGGRAADISVGGSRGVIHL